MKLTWSGLAFIFFAAATSALGQSSDLKGHPPPRQDSHQSPEVVVREYYTAYLAWLTFFEKKENRELPPEAGVLGSPAVAWDLTLPKVKNGCYLIPGLIGSAADEWVQLQDGEL